MPRARPLTAAAFAAALVAAAAAFAADDTVVNGLVRNAWYWQARARSDKAEEAWKQVLEAAPDNPDALAAIGSFNARAGRLQQAREALATRSSSALASDRCSRKRASSRTTDAS